MSHAISRSLLPVVVVSLMLATAACGSDTPPSPAVVREVARPTPVGPTPSIAIVPDPTPVASPSSPVVGPGFWTTTGSMTHGHSYGATVTVLQDGRVLVAGGEAASGLISAAADLYDPTTDRWAATGKLLSPRRGAVSTLLADGRVLVTGGIGGPPRIGELYDPRTGSWSRTRPMTHPHYAASVATLPAGHVLVFGGYGDGYGPTRRAEIYDPTNGTWRATDSLSAPAGPSAVLADGRVLVLHDADRPEVFDPTTARWRAVARPPSGSYWTAAVRLVNGDVLLLSPRTGTAATYDPTADTWTAANGPHTGAGPAVLLDDGTVLVVGNVRSARFDPSTGAWTDVPRPPLSRDYALDSVDGVELNLMAKLHDGRVLATELRSAAVYDPSSSG